MAFQGGGLDCMIQMKAVIPLARQLPAAMSVRRIFFFCVCVFFFFLYICIYVYPKWEHFSKQLVL